MTNNNLMVIVSIPEKDEDNTLPRNEVIPFESNKELSDIQSTLSLYKDTGTLFEEEEDLNIEDEVSSLQLAPLTVQTGSPCLFESDSDIESIDDRCKDTYNGHYHSPVSSNASVVASDLEEERYDDLEFPAVGLYNWSSLIHENQDDLESGLEIPDAITLISKLNKKRFGVQTPPATLNPPTPIPESPIPITKQLQEISHKSNHTLNDDLNGITCDDLDDDILPVHPITNVNLLKDTDAFNLDLLDQDDCALDSISDLEDNDIVPTLPTDSTPSPSIPKPKMKLITLKDFETSKKTIETKTNSISNIPKPNILKSTQPWKKSGLRETKDVLVKTPTTSNIQTSSNRSKPNNTFDTQRHTKLNSSSYKFPLRKSDSQQFLNSPMVSSTNLRENRDLKRPPTYRVAFGRTLGCTDERDRHAQNKQYVTPKQHKKKGPQKPTLIRNLGSSGIPKVVGKMVYDPVSQIWKGNERELDVFEQSNQSSTPTRPSLIPHISTLNTPMTVGRMKFDPVKMCWTGNEEDEEDAHLFDDIESFEIQQETKTEYVLDKSVKESFLLSEANHKLLMGQWYPRVVGENRSVLRDSSKTFLYEIRSIRC